MPETQRRPGHTGFTWMFQSARRRKREETIDRLYGVIVAHARLPVFYRTLAVPDTIEGRFDLLVLHVHLLFRRLAHADETIRSVGQSVFDRFIEDMDDSLRELGVGDLTVPKRMRAMGVAFYGRAAVYDAALGEPGDDALAAALMRNVYGNNSGAETNVQRLARYVRKAASALAAQDASTIASGVVEFPTPEEN
jgi:cytochrome b pre-mRNA-processing protein 3